MSQELVKQFISDVEQFRQDHCNPGRPDGWLPREEWFRKYHLAMAKNNEVFDYLCRQPDVGKDAADAMLFQLAGMLREHQRCTELLLNLGEPREGRPTRDDFLRDLRNTFENVGVQELYGTFREAAGVTPDKPVLSKNAAAVYEFLLEQPPHRGFTGPILLDELHKRGHFFSQSDLTSRIVPELGPYGIENAPRKGYRIPPTERPSP